MGVVPVPPRLARLLLRVLQMTGELGILVVLAVLCARVLLVRAARARLSAHGALLLAWRWLSGHPWHGKAITDAGWLRPGTRAFTKTGHAPRFHYLPRWRRAASRSGRAAAAVLLLLIW